MLAQERLVTGEVLQFAWRQQRPCGVERRGVLRADVERVLVDLLLSAQSSMS